MASSLPGHNNVILVEVVYALPDEQEILQVSLPEDSTVLDALRESGLIDRKFADENLNVVPGVTPVGIYGDKVAYDDLLEDGDRIEVYRPLVIDPMEARRARAQKQQADLKKKKG